MAKVSWTPELIQMGVVDVLSETLDVDEDEIQLSSILEKDLGQESIDLLAISYCAGRTFSLGKEEVDQSIREICAARWAIRAPLTWRSRSHESRSPEEYIDATKQKYPFLDLVQMITVEDLDFITVEFFCKLIAHKLGVEWTPPPIPAPAQ
jgi:hypothetical protein